MIMNRVKTALGRLAKSEGGAVSADFVLLTALIMALALGTVNIVMGDAGDNLVALINKVVG